jgi:hypothetical protein
MKLSVNDVLYHITQHEDVYNTFFRIEETPITAIRITKSNTLYIETTKFNTIFDTDYKQIGANGIRIYNTLEDAKLARKEVIKNTIDRLNKDIDRISIKVANIALQLKE